MFRRIVERTQAAHDGLNNNQADHEGDSNQADHDDAIDSNKEADTEYSVDPEYTSN